MNKVFLRQRFTKPVLAFILIAALQGCATYGASIVQVRNDVASSHFVEAEQALERALKPRGDDQLLYYLESGMLAHLQGRYNDSNNLLEQAYLLIDPINNKSISDRLRTVALSPRSSTYMGNDFERSMVGFIKLLNFMSIANQSDTDNQRYEALESARVESRRIRIALDLAESKEPSNGNGRTKHLSDMNRLVSDMMGDQINQPVVSSSVPMLDLLTSYIYEMLDEQDNARIAFDRSLGGYEQGLGHSPQKPGELISWVAPESEVETGELILVQLTGLIPEQKELSFFAGLNSGGILYFSNGNGADDDSGFWFNSVLSGPAGYQVYLNHQSGRQRYAGRSNQRVYFSHVSHGYFESRSPLLNVLVQGFRVALPYYPSSAYQLDSESSVVWQDENADTALGLSLARKVVEDHAAQAWKELFVAFAREFFQQLIAETLYQATNDSDSQLTSFLGAVGKVSAFAGAQADTRSWLTLPREIRIARIKLPAGKHTLSVQTNFRYSGYDKTQEIVVDIAPGQIHFMSLYTADGPTLINRAETQ